MTPFVDSLVRRMLPHRIRLKHGLMHRPQYGYCMWHAAVLAKRLGQTRISVLEFGVAGGNGLCAIEGHAGEIERRLSVKFDVYGFDVGSGLPPPQDFRDLPYHWQAGFFKMDEGRLRSRLRSANLVLGDVKETSGRFFEEHAPAPIGCIFHDLDLYSSTRDSFQILEGPQKFFLPRVFNYFDDIIGTETELYNDYTGQRLAIAEFNQAHAGRKLARCYQFARRPRRAVWHEQIFILHDFDHPLYNTFISEADQALPLDS